MTRKRAGADVIRDDAQAAVGEIAGVEQRGRGLHQVLEQVDVVVVGDALHHRRHALETRARVHGRLRQRRELAVGRAVELHEHEVPDFDPAIAVGIGRARRAARNVRAVIEEDFGARTAGAGVAHLPEVVGAAARLVADAHDLVCRARRSSCARDRRLRRRSAYTVTMRRAGSIFSVPVTKSQAKRMASFLK